MPWHNPTAKLFVPDGTAAEVALARTTHLAVAAHPDDIEIMAADGILRCFRQRDRWFTGVIVTDGSGSPRTGLYADYSDAAMRAVRRKEQEKAAVLGEYSAQLFLDYPSSAVKGERRTEVVEDLVALLEATQPEIIYTHNLADKHATHVAVALRLIEALRRLPPEKRPRHLYGCEVWRDLDWMCDEDKVALNVSAHENLQMALLGLFDSQIAGGKRYDLATMGRRRAHATYFASHDVDAATGLTFAMELTPLIEDPTLSIEAFVLDFIQRFADEVSCQLARLGA
jgi:LmbE family N-acetylglucosaminyl deacetylase